MLKCWDFNVEMVELQRVGWLYSVCVYKTMTCAGKLYAKECVA